MDGKQIYENFTTGDTRNLRSAADRLQELTEACYARNSSIKALQDRMMQSWTGAAADAANAGAAPLGDAFRATAGPLDLTAVSVNIQADSFDGSGKTVVPVPDKPEKPNPWTTGLKGAIPIAGPFMVNNDIKNYQEGVAKHNAANETNVRVMDQYNVVTNGTKASLPSDYGVLKSDGADITIKTEGPGPIKPPVFPPKPKKVGGDDDNGTDDNSDDDSTTSSSTTKTDTGQNQNQNQNQTKPTVDEHVVNPRDKNDNGTTVPSKTKPGAGDDRTVPTGTGKVRPGQNTEIPGRTPGRNPGGDRDDVIGLPGGTGQNYSQGPNTGPGQPGPGGRSVSGPGSAAGRLLGGEGGAGGRGGGIGGPGSSGSLGAGKGSGMGGFGSMSGAEGAAGRGAAGRGGSGQMGPMGAGGRRGEGDEDEEHQRPDFLIEADPDAIFGTDERTSPPVIGE